MLTTAPKPHPSAVRLCFDRFEVDEAEARLACAGEAVAIAPKPFAVLCALTRTPQMLVSKNVLLDAVWGHRFVSESVLKSAISDVRSALHDDPRQPRYIETVHGRGYRFVAAGVSAAAQPALAEAIDAVGAPGQSAQAALTLLCRTDAALAGLIRAVAATLDRERSPSAKFDAAQTPAVNGFERELVLC
jgi:DNA-binding winged helix-turn-helix (wHTH) protein